MIRFTDTRMNFVIGSGPAGVAAAHALVSRGLAVTMIDAGLMLEEKRMETVQKLRQTPPEAWDKTWLNKIRGDAKVNVGGVSQKLIFGSNFPYKDVEQYIPMVMKGVKTSASLARGGLSNVWGAGVMPYGDADIGDWPINYSDLEPHYRSVFSYMPLAAREDPLAGELPLIGSHYQSLKPSRQSTEFLADIQKAQDKLKVRGITAGHSRLAVQAGEAMGLPGCIYCGLCMYGCPYGLIYNSADTLTELQREENFSYIANVVVEKLLEANGKVKILARSKLNDKTQSFQGTRVFLACGTLSTTRILLESLEAYHHPVKLHDNQYFIFPLLRYRKIPRVASEDLYTLSQIFIEIHDPALSKENIHLSLYGYNDMYSRVFEGLFRSLWPFIKIPFNELLGRLFIVQGNLHSRLSPKITACLAPGSDRLRILNLESAPQRKSSKIVRGVLKKLYKNRKNLCAVPVFPMLQIGQAGQAHHSGGAFPMRENPGNFESDTLGRPYGFRRVHVVDSTVFPSIPAGSITLTVMANADRIASAAASLGNLN